MQYFYISIFWLVSLAEQVSLSQFEQADLGRSTLFAIKTSKIQLLVKLDVIGCFVCLFCCFTSQVNSYGHGGKVSSPNHTFFLGKLEQAVNQ